MAYDQKTDQALRAAFNQLGVRIAPDVKTSTMVEELKTLGQMDCSVDAGVLTLTQNGAVVSTGVALTAYVGKKPEHFVVEGGQIRSKDQLLPRDTPEGVRQRVELINKQGFNKFSQIMNNESLRPGVVASREMSKRDWLNLTLAEKTAAVREDPGIVGHVMAKRR